MNIKLQGLLKQKNGIKYTTYWKHVGLSLDHMTYLSLTLSQKNDRSLQSLPNSISCWKSNLFNSRFMVCPEASTKDKSLAKHSFKMCGTQCWCFGRLKICAIGSTYTPNNLVRLKIMHWHCFWVICMLSAYIMWPTSHTVIPFTFHRTLKRHVVH